MTGILIRHAAELAVAPFAPVVLETVLAVDLLLTSVVGTGAKVETVALPHCRQLMRFHATPRILTPTAVRILFMHWFLKNS
jgi:hypothetical protein